MKGNQQIIDQLNLRLVEELTAINQYKNNLSLFVLWGYEKLAEYIKERIEDEQKHYNKLLDRIRFLGGMPIVGKLNEVKTGQDISKIHENDLVSEIDAVQKYNETIHLCVALGDNGTRLIIEEILKDEEEHINDLEKQLIEIKQIGTQNFLSTKI